MIVVWCSHHSYIWDAGGQIVRSRAPRIEWLRVVCTCGVRRAGENREAGDVRCFSRNAPLEKGRGRVADRPHSSFKNCASEKKQRNQNGGMLQSHHEMKTIVPRRRTTKDVNEKWHTCFEIFLFTFGFEYAHMKNFISKYFVYGFIWFLHSW